MKKNESTKFSKGSSFFNLFWITLIALFLLKFFSSIWFETLLPLIRAGDKTALTQNIIGIPISIAGTLVIVYAGFVFLRKTIVLFSNDTFNNKVKIVQNKEEHYQRVRIENMKTLWEVWKQPLRLFIGGFLLIAISGYLINLSL